MSENKTILTTRRFELWWRKAQAWFATQFASIKVDLTPVEEKVDEVKSDVADMKTAVENIDTSDLAKQGTDHNATLTAILEALTGGGGIEIMTDDEYEPALEDLDKMLDEVGTEDNENA